jgi:ABC-2 type transport system ATP-binding protein
VGEALEFVNLSGDADRFTSGYSGGMLQRLALGITYLKEVPLLLLDEPTLNLDPSGMEQFREWMLKLRRAGVTVLFTSHVLQEALRLADRVGVMVEGHLVRVLEVAGFRERVVAATSVRVVVDRLSPAMIEAARQAGAEEVSRGETSYAFKAPPGKRQKVIRALENAGGLIEELHTDPPNWESLTEVLSER